MVGCGSMVGSCMLVVSSTTFVRNVVGDGVLGSGIVNRGLVDSSIFYW